MVGQQQRAKAIDCPRNEDTCDVTYLMRQRRSEIRAGGKQRDGRHRDAVGNAVVEGAIAALVNPRRKGIEEALRAIR